MQSNSGWRVECSLHDTLIQLWTGLMSISSRNELNEHARSSANPVPKLFRVVEACLRLPTFEYYHMRLWCSAGLAVRGI
jgi:hypothetical protein